MKSKMLSYFFLAAALLSVYGDCSKPPAYPDYLNAKGYVIGKETCNADTTKDYWLIDLTYFSDTPQYGDTLLLNGIKYTNTVKTKGLAESLKQIGMRVSLDFKEISKNKIVTTNCSVANSVTYNLKDLLIIYQGEIR